MIKKLFFSFILSFLFMLFSQTNTKAIYDPLSVPNNRYGIHILERTDLKDAAELVNSSGGDWGYVTFVIREDDRNNQKWQEFFDDARRLHLIPIVRIASKQGEKGWEKLKTEDIDNWVTFLNSLNWVIENRYIIVGNETNHAAEWGGEVNPEEYTAYLLDIAEKLKYSNKDYFILAAGMDPLAPDKKGYMSEEEYLRRMVTFNKDFLRYVDGWVSHSYGSVNYLATGKGTFNTYKWELDLLKSLGLSKKLPVFITETGLPHDKEGEITKFESQEGLTQKLKSAYQVAFNDPEIVAVTPFILNYQAPPFDIFSWKKPDGNFYEIYYQIKNLPKSKGIPRQLQSIDVISIVFPPLMPDNGYLSGIVTIKNNGQSIWDGSEKINAENRGYPIQIQPLVIFSNVEPGKKSPAIIKIKISKN